MGTRRSAGCSRVIPNGYIQDLSDIRIHSLGDAASIIRARYIEIGDDDEGRIDLLHNLDSRDLEYLVAAVWRAQEYSVSVTTATKDRGKDVIATREGVHKEMVFLECRGGLSKSDVTEVRALLGVVESEKASRGVLVSIAGFTKGIATAQEFADGNSSRISLVNGAELVALANEFLGHDWPRRVDSIIALQKRDDGP